MPLEVQCNNVDILEERGYEHGRPFMDLDQESSRESIYLYFALVYHTK